MVKNGIKNLARNHLEQNSVTLMQALCTNPEPGHITICLGILQCDLESVLKIALLQHVTSYLELQKRLLSNIYRLYVFQEIHLQPSFLGSTLKSSH